MNLRRKLRGFASGLLAASLIWAVLLLSVPARGAEAAAALPGSYYGIDAAKGATLTVEAADAGLHGTFSDTHGNSQAFDAQPSGDGATAVLDMGGQQVLLLVVPLPFGAKVTLVPYNAEGKLNTAAGRMLDFVRSGLHLPEPDRDYVPAPKDARGRITANAFLASYEFWAPAGVRAGYLSLNERARTLMRLFPAVQLDVIWKLCLAPDAQQALAMALRGQGVTCAQVLDGIAESQQMGKFDQYKAEVRDEKATLRLNMRCVGLSVVPQKECERAARALSAQAVNLDTAATVLARYR